MPILFLEYYVSIKIEVIMLTEQNSERIKIVEFRLGLDIGKRIVGYYDAEFESDPPLRITDKIEVISQ
jgi:hypothetical protein